MLGKPAELLGAMFRVNATRAGTTMPSGSRCINGRCVFRLPQTDSCTVTQSPVTALNSGFCIGRVARNGYYSSDCIE